MSDKMICNHAKKCGETPDRCLAVVPHECKTHGGPVWFLCPAIKRWVKCVPVQEEKGNG